MNALNPNLAFNLPSFDEYIIRNRASIQPTTIKDATKKWLPVLEKYFSNYNIDSELMSNICLYIELPKTGRRMTWRRQRPEYRK